MNQINILHIEDNLEDADVVASSLKQSNLYFKQTIVNSKDDFTNYLDIETPDVILSEYSLPAFHSLEALEIVKQKGLHLPFILLTGHATEALAASIIEAGADDYISKDKMQRLPIAILNNIAWTGHKSIQAMREAAWEEEVSAANTTIHRLSQRLRLAADSAGMGIWEYDLVSNRIKWDGSMCRLYNLNEEKYESLYETWLLMLHPHDKEQIRNEIVSAIAGTKEFDTEFRIVCEGGMIRHIKARGIVERNPDGKAVSMIGVNWDITDNKYAELHLKELNEDLQNQSAQLAKSNTSLEQHIKLIEGQNQKLKDIVWTQSHIARAPLTKMMGIADLIKNLEATDPECELWVNHFIASANELDNAIKEIVKKAMDAIVN